MKATHKTVILYCHKDKETGKNLHDFTVMGEVLYFLGEEEVTKTEYRDKKTLPAERVEVSAGWVSTVLFGQEYPALTGFETDRSGSRIVVRDADDREFISVGSINGTFDLLNVVPAPKGTWQKAKDFWEQVRSEEVGREWTLTGNPYFCRF